MQVYKKILVTMDCSSVDDAVVKHVTALALQNSAEVYLLHVVHSHTLDQDRILREKAEKMLNSHCDSMRNQGIDVHILIRSGEPDDQILQEIDENDYDLLAMATHGHKFFGDLLFGSVSTKLKHKIKIPLLLLASE
jgi:nucleotide-binding universal stress UspA family protein